MIELSVLLSSVLAQVDDYTTTTTENGAAAGTAVASLLFGLVFYIFYAYCLMRIFDKAGVTPWWAWVPILNTYGMIKASGHEGWWIILYLIPCVNIVVALIVLIDLAKAFGKGGGFALGLIFLSFIFIPILAFGDSRYIGPRPSY